MPVLVTTESWKKKAIEVHGDTYDYSQSVYEGAFKPITIVCRKHGPFQQRAAVHLKGSGCIACFRESRKTGTDKFIQQAIAVHGNRYDYSKAEYKRSNVKVTIICPIHGEFQITPDSHISGKQGCKRCGVERRSKAATKDINYFLEKARKVHGDLYDYSKATYKGASTELEIVCRVHGSFWQKPAYHYDGHGCPQCGVDRRSGIRKIGTEEFIRKAKEIHGERYDYSQAEYITSNDPITVICPEHGPFYPVPNNHINSKTICPVCSLSEPSKIQEEIGQFLSSLGANVKQNDRTLLRPKEVDIVIPDHRLGIEVCGLYWHRTREARPSTYHRNKMLALQDVGYQLITLFEDEWYGRKEAVKGVLSAKLNSPIRVGARECKLEEVDTKCAREFLEKHHLMGAAQAELHLGLSFLGGLIAVASFSRPRVIFKAKAKDFVELVRFGKDPRYAISGGLARLCKRGMAHFPHDALISYVDRRWFTGESYLREGFEFVAETPPNYWYCKGANRYSRFSFAKHTLSKKLAVFDPALTEKQNMLANKYFIVHDCGHLKMAWKR